MDVKGITKKLQGALGKYRYALIVLLIGLALLLIPEKSTKSKSVVVENEKNSVQQSIELDALAEILQSIHGVGKTQVLLSIASGEQIVYQTNSDITMSDNNNSTKIETVIITNSQRVETGLVQQINPPQYLGAIVVCQGADNPTVKLAVTQAVAKITGLGADDICVLKMK